VLNRDHKSSLSRLILAGSTWYLADHLIRLSATMTRGSVRGRRPDTERGPPETGSNGLRPHPIAPSRRLDLSWPPTALHATNNDDTMSEDPRALEKEVWPPATPRSPHETPAEPLEHRQRRPSQASGAGSATRQQNTKKPPISTSRPPSPTRSRT